MRRLLFVLGALTMFGPLTTDLYLPALPHLARDLGATVGHAQVTFTATVIGLALGQVFAGPVADHWGRRTPLMLGLVSFTLSSAACALVDSITVVAVLRLLQGMSGAAGITIARAMVRDEFEGIAAARAFSTLATMFGVGPIVAPALGGLVLLVSDWRGVFWLQGAIGVVLMAATVAWTHETLPLQRRRAGGLRDVLHSFRLLGRDGGYLNYLIPGVCSTIVVFGFISSSTYVYQDHYGFDPQVYGFLFAGNGLAMIAVNVLNRRLLGRVPQRRLLEAGFVWIASSGAAIAVALLLDGPAALVAPLVWVAFGGLGLVIGNYMSLALEDQGERAGAASGLMGLTQFTVGAIVAQIIGLVGATPAAMGITMGVGGVSALAAYHLIAALRASRATPRSREA